VVCKTYASALSDYAKKTWVTNQGYITTADLSGYALKSDIPNMDNYVPIETYNALVLRVKALEDAISSGGGNTNPGEGS
jgi:hypothetical protein